MVEQPASAGPCVATHAPDAHVISASQDTLGSVPYSHVCSLLQVVPACGLEAGQDDVVSADEDLQLADIGKIPAIIMAATVHALLDRQVIMTVE